MAEPTIKSLVASLRKHIQGGTLGAELVKAITNELAGLGYQYDYKQFPSLAPDRNWTDTSSATPASLAEALLWKMGKWKIYKSFLAHYTDGTSVPSSTDVVFYAFAKHLRNSNEPIYDQHALRALWAVDMRLTTEQVHLCRKLLAKMNGDWKAIASGVDARKGYLLYVERISELTKMGASLDALDKLFMPLGQALKRNSKNVSEFAELIGVTH